jgi:hypothetical protein
MVEFQAVFSSAETKTFQLLTPLRIKHIMQLVNKIIIATVMATASLTVIAAETPGAAKVRMAVEGTISKIEHAIKFAQDTNESDEAVTESINEARQLQKEFRFEGTERQRQKANEKLRVAREAFAKGDKAAGIAGLNEALESFVAMKAIYLKGI